GKPFNRVITIFAFVDEWLPDARRAETPATVLRRKNVAAPGIELRPQFYHFFFIRRAQQDDRRAFQPHRPVDVGREFGSVAHGNADATVYDKPISTRVE